MKYSGKKVIRLISAFMVFFMLFSCVSPHLQSVNGINEVLQAEAAENDKADEPVFDASAVGQYVLNVGSEYYKNTDEIMVSGNMTIQLMHVDQNGNPKAIEVPSGTSMEVKWNVVDEANVTGNVFRVEPSDKAHLGFDSFCDVFVTGVGYNNLTVSIQIKNGEKTETITYVWKLYVALALDGRNITIDDDVDVDDKGIGQYGLRFGLNTDKVMDTLQIAGPEVRNTERSKYNKYFLLLRDKNLIYQYTKGDGTTGVLDNYATEEIIEKDAKLRNMLEEKVVWTTSNSDVATVKYGVITGQGAGTAVITATTYSSDQLSQKSISITVVVKPSAYIEGINTKYESKFDAIAPSSNFTVTTNAKVSSELMWTVYNKDDKGQILWSSELGITPKTFHVETYKNSGNVYFSGVPAGTYYVTARVSDRYAEDNKMIGKLEFKIIVPVLFDTETLYMNVNDIYDIIENSTIPDPGWFKYESSQENVVTVGSNGVITAVGNGTATVTMTRLTGGKYESVFENAGDYKHVPTSCSIYVKVIDSILINYTSATIYVGGTLNLKATTTSNNVVEWKSSDEKIATVDEYGIVTAHKEGTAVITAIQYVNGVKKTASCKVTVRQGVTGVTLNPSQKELGIGDNLTINATVAPDLNGVSLKWVSSDDKVVTVLVHGDLSATVQAVGAGTAVISAINQDNVVVGSCLITVYEPIKSITLSQTNVVLPLADGWFQLFATIVPQSAEDQEIVWRSTNTSVATVDSNGVVQLKKAGQTSIIVSSRVDANITAICNVEVTKSVTGVKLDKSVHDMFVGETLRLTYTITPAGASNSQVTWSTSNKSVAIVDQSGLVTAKAVGTTVIMVKTKDGGFTALCTVNVGRVATAIKLDVTSLVLNTGDYYYLESTLTPADTTEKTVSFESSDTKVAVVSKKGKVTAKAAGNCVIMAKTKSGSMAYCSVEVLQAVTGVKLSQKKIELFVGDLYRMEESVLPKNATNKKVEWSTSNKKVFTVNSDGEITGVGSGVAVLTCTTDEGGFTAFCDVVVNQGPTGIKLSKKVIELYAGETYQAEYEVLPKDSYDKSVKWESSDTKIFKVDNKGKVTGVGGGTAILKCTTQNGHIVAYCDVKVKQGVTGIKLAEDVLEIAVGEELEMDYEVLPDDALNKKVKWTSSDSKVLKVDKEGKITGAGAGIAVLTCTTTEGKYSDFCVVTVHQGVEEVKLSVESIKVAVGESKQMEYDVLPKDSHNKEVKWKSSDTKVFKVDKKGKVTGVGVGAALLYCTSEQSGVLDYCTVTVWQNVTGLELAATAIEIKKGEEYEMDVKVLPENAEDKNIQWVSSDENVFTVDEDGEILGVGGGMAILTCISEAGNCKESCVVTVIEEVTSVDIDKEFLKLGLNTMYQLNATILSERATNKDVVWSSSDPEIVTVDDRGRVRGLQLGYATITCSATDDSNAYDLCEVRVCIPVTEIELDVSYITLVQGKSYTVSAKVYPDNATYQDPIWTSENPDIAIVSPQGVITALNPGSTIVRATADDSGEVSALCYVNVLKPVPATGITVAESEIVMAPGEQKTVAVSLLPSNTTEYISWSSDNTAVATVDPETGMITANAIGTANINVLTESGHKGRIQVFVVGLSRTYVELQQYSALLLKLEVDGSGSKDFTVRWDVDNQHIATVANGKVTAKAIGTTTVYAVVNGRRLGCVVKVVKIK